LAFKCGSKEVEREKLNRVVGELRNGGGRAGGT
jgi:hypothetical protein